MVSHDMGWIRCALIRVTVPIRIYTHARAHTSSMKIVSLDCKSMYSKDKGLLYVTVMQLDFRVCMMLATRPDPASLPNALGFHVCMICGLTAHPQLFPSAGEG